MSAGGTAAGTRRSVTTWDELADVVSFAEVVDRRHVLVRVLPRPRLRL